MAGEGFSTEKLSTFYNPVVLRLGNVKAHSRWSLPGMWSMVYWTLNPYCLALAMYWISSSSWFHLQCFEVVVFSFFLQWCGLWHILSHFKKKPPKPKNACSHQICQLVLYS